MKHDRQGQVVVVHRPLLARLAQRRIRGTAGDQVGDDNPLVGGMITMATLATMIVPISAPVVDIGATPEPNTCA